MEPARVPLSVLVIGPPRSLDPSRIGRFDGHDLCELLSFRSISEVLIYLRLSPLRFGLLGFGFGIARKNPVEYIFV